MSDLDFINRKLHIEFWRGYSQALKAIRALYKMDYKMNGDRQVYLSDLLTFMNEATQNAIDNIKKHDMASDG